MRSQLCDRRCTVLQERPRLKKLPSTNLRCEYSYLERGQNLLYHPTSGNNSRFCSQRPFSISTLSGLKFRYQNPLLRLLVVLRRKPHLNPLTLPRRIRRKHLPQSRLQSLKRKNQYICLMFTSPQPLRPSRDISVLDRRSSVMAYPRIRCPTPHS